MAGWAGCGTSLPELQFFFESVLSFLGKARGAKKKNFPIFFSKKLPEKFNLNSLLSLFRTKNPPTWVPNPPANAAAPRSLAPARAHLPRTVEAATPAPAAVPRAATTPATIADDPPGAAAAAGILLPTRPLLPSRQFTRSLDTSCTLHLDQQPYTLHLACIVTPFTQAVNA